MSTRQSNRSSMPQIAAIVDQIRAMGIDVKVLYAKENGSELGKKPSDDPSCVFVIPPRYRYPYDEQPKGKK